VISILPTGVSDVHRDHRDDYGTTVDGWWCTLLVVMVVDGEDTAATGRVVEHMRQGPRILVWSSSDLLDWADQQGGRLSLFAKEHGPRSSPMFLYHIYNVAHLFVIRHGARWIVETKPTTTTVTTTTAPTTPSSFVRGLQHITTKRMALIGQRKYDQTLLNPKRPLSASTIDSAFQTITMGDSDILKNMDNIALLHPYHQEESLSSSSSASSSSSSVIVIPHHVYVRYDTDVTLYPIHSFWSLLFPLSSTVDVESCRGLVSQRLYQELATYVGLVPMVTNTTDTTTTTTTTTATKAFSDDETTIHSLVDFLSSYRGTATAVTTTLSRRVEELWTSLHTHRFLQRPEDIRRLKVWLEALLEHPQPQEPEPRRQQQHLPTAWLVPSRLKRRQIYDTVLLGQFNYNNSVPDVLFWYQKWRQNFRHIVVRGPFDDDAVHTLRHRYGIDEVYRGRDDRGYYSPMENLMRTLEQYQADPDIHGVLYVHDDAFLNVTNIPYMGGDSLMITDDVTNPRPVHPTPEQLKHIMNHSFSIHRNGTYSKADGTSYETFEALLETLQLWHYWPSTHSYHSMLTDPDFVKYLEEDGSVLVPKPFYGRADVMYVPMKLANQYIEATTLILNHGIYLETGMSKIVDMICRTAGATNSTTPVVVSIPLHTTWRGRQRNSLRMFLFSDFPTTVIHPFKLSRGYDKWDYAFEWMTTSTKTFVYPSDERRKMNKKKHNNHNEPNEPFQ
jgi:hypothetical protein